MVVDVYRELGATIPLVTMLECLPHNQSVFVTSLVDTIVLQLTQMTKTMPLSFNNLYIYIRVLNAVIAIKKGVRKAVSQDPGEHVQALYAQFLDYAKKIELNLSALTGSPQRTMEIAPLLKTLPFPFPATIPNIQMYVKTLFMIYFGNYHNCICLLAVPSCVRMNSHP